MRRKLLLIYLFISTVFLCKAQWNDPGFTVPFKKNLSEQLDSRFVMDTATKKIFVDCYIRTFAGMFKTPKDAFSIGQDSLLVLEGKVLRNCMFTEADKIKTLFMKWEYIEKVSHTYMVSVAQQFVPDLKQLKPYVQKWMLKRTFELYKLYYPLGMPLKVAEYVSLKIQKELVREAKLKGYIR